MRKIRFGVIGTNFVSDWVIAGARQDPRFELSAVCSRTRERAAEFAARHRIPHTFTSLEEMVSTDMVDAVYIATPNSTHAAYAMLCMEHGKHVLCEKPLASNLREVEAMIEAAHRHGVTLMEAMKTTLTPNFRAVMRALPRVGRVRRYFAAFCQYSSRYDKFKEGIVLNAFRPELSNGAMMDIGVYTIYPMVVLFGRPRRISASGILLSSGVDAQGSVEFEYDGMNATVIYSKIANSALPTEIQGEDGNLTLDRINHIGSVVWQPRPAAASGRELPTEPEVLTVPVEHDEYYYEMAEFLDLIETGRLESSVNSHEHSRICIAIIDEVRRQLGVTYPADRF